MQSLIEIQKDLVSLNRTAIDLSKKMETVENAVTDLKGKVVRAEIIGTTIGAAIVVIGIVFWWLFSGPITYLRDQIVNQEPAITSPAANTPSKSG